MNALKAPSFMFLKLPTNTVSEDSLILQYLFGLWVVIPLQ